MSRIRANKITNKVGTGAIELEKGAQLPVGMGITGAGSINLTGIITATTINATTFQGVDSTAPVPILFVILFALILDINLQDIQVNCIYTTGKEIIHQV